MKLILFVLVLTCIGLLGCTDPEQAKAGSAPDQNAAAPTSAPDPTHADSNQAADSEPSTAAANSAQSDTQHPEAWLGQWLGPEGTYLKVTKHADQFMINIKNLDGERSFKATQSNYGTLMFLRDGVSLELKPATGKQTGMKWLADKTNCLMVEKGEGYCRS